MRSLKSFCLEKNFIHNYLANTHALLPIQCRLVTPTVQALRSDLDFEMVIKGKSLAQPLWVPSFFFFCSSPCLRSFGASCQGLSLNS